MEPPRLPAVPTSSRYAPNPSGVYDAAGVPGAPGAPAPRGANVVVRSLAALDEQPAVQTASRAFARGKRMIRPYAPYATRALLVSTFLEDGLRSLVQYDEQTRFFAEELWLPRAVVMVYLVANAGVAVCASGMLFVKRFEKRALCALLASVMAQQMLYGRHSPITTGNWGFLLRNSCLAGNILLLLVTNTESDAFKTLSLPGLFDGRMRGPASAKASPEKFRDAVAFAARVLFALLVLEMFDVIGVKLALVAPVCIALLLGYKTDVMAVVLVMYYLIATLLSKQFWILDPAHPHDEFRRGVLRYEFIQSLSLMSGLLVLMMSGPGALSLDDKLRKGKAW